MLLIIEEAEIYGLCAQELHCHYKATHSITIGTFLQHKKDNVQTSDSAEHECKNAQKKRERETKI